MTKLLLGFELCRIYNSDVKYVISFFLLLETKLQNLVDLKLPFQQLNLLIDLYVLPGGIYLQHIKNDVSFLRCSLSNARHC